MGQIANLRESSQNRELFDLVERLLPVLLAECAHLGLGARDLSVLATLLGRPAATISDLGAQLSIPPSTMTAVVDRLERRGLVARSHSKEDRRVVTVRATPGAARAMGPVARSATDRLLAAAPETANPTARLSP